MSQLDALELKPRESLHSSSVRLFISDDLAKAASTRNYEVLHSGFMHRGFITLSRAHNDVSAMVQPPQLLVSTHGSVEDRRIKLSSDQY